MKILMNALGGCVLAAGAAAAAEPAPPPPLWAGQVGVSYVGTTGNTDTSSLGAAAEVHYRPGVWSGDAKVDLVRAATNGDVSARSLSALLRGARGLTPRFEVYAQAGYLENTFAGIDQRLAGEVGVAYGVLAGPEHTLKAEVGLGYTKEMRVTEADRSFASGRAGLAYKWQLSKTADLSDEVSFTEDLKDSDDWRFGNTLAVTAALNSLLSLKASYVLTTNNQPPVGFKKSDTLTSLALVAKF